MFAATEWLYNHNSDGALPNNNDGSVFRIIVPKDSAAITTPDYTLTLPENWKNNFKASATGNSMWI